MTRIVAGSAKGRVLRVPKSGTRPTSEKVREALLGSLEHRGYIAGCRIADLFGGSGAVGLEARSRGAAYVEEVEAHRAAADVIRANAESTGLDVVVRQQKVEAWAEAAHAEPFDLIFLDPPYAYSDEAIDALVAKLGPLLQEDGAIAVERDARSREPRWPADWERLDDRLFGDTRVWMARPGVSPDRLES